MIQNIQFPEGTVVKYQRGSILDQFDPGIKLSFAPTYGGGYYEFSQLYSARDNINTFRYCFKFSKCYYKITETESDIAYMFNEGNCFYDLIFDKSIRITDASSLLNRGKTNFFMKISANINDKVSNFLSSTPIYYLDWDIDTSSWTSTYIFGSDIRAMNGYFSMANYNNVSYYTFTGFTQPTRLRKFTIKDFGTKSGFTSGDFSYWTAWGLSTPAIPDARQSLIDSLITYSFDRAAAGYRTCTIKLAPKTKALLTEEEIAQITAKGYTIS